MASTSLVGFASANRMGSGLQAFGVGVQPVSRGILRSSIRYDGFILPALDWSNGQKCFG